MSRYDAEGLEAEQQPGAEEGVLRNSLDLLSKKDIDDAETELLEKLYEKVLGEPRDVLRFEDIQRWHRLWLGNLYPWAGSLRSVNMSKGGFHFAAANTLPKLIENFERDYLAKFPTLSTATDDELISYMAESHVEFILIHPFREGNGRISRLLLDVMALEAGLAPLDYQLWEDHKDFYFRSIQAGVGGDYSHMERLIGDVLDKQG